MATAVWGACAHATLYTYDFNGINALIPDGDVNGYQNSQSVTGPFNHGPNDTSEIVDVNVTLSISGGYNGDLYGYLVHSSGFAVLVNRVGRISGDAFGYADTGFDVTIDGQASGHTVNDIHLYRAAGNSPAFSSGRLTGSWLEDGRADDPDAVTGNTANRNALLSSFNALSASGTWTLFLADLSFGEQSTLNSWGLQISTVPEPVNRALLGLAGLFAGANCFILLRRRRRKCSRLW